MTGLELNYNYKMATKILSKSSFSSPGFFKVTNSSFKTLSLILDRGSMAEMVYMLASCSKVPKRIGSERVSTINSA